MAWHGTYHSSDVHLTAGNQLFLVESSNTVTMILFAEYPCKLVLLLLYPPTLAWYHRISPFQLGHTGQDSLLVRRTDGIVSVKDVAEGSGENLGPNGTHAAHGILVQERVTTNREFHFGALDQIERWIEFLEFFQSAVAMTLVVVVVMMMMMM